MRKRKNPQLPYNLKCPKCGDKIYSLYYGIGNIPKVIVMRKYCEKCDLVYKFIIKEEKIKDMEI
jgi:hypothetical protein